jgi:hypothetical protein
VVLACYLGSFDGKITLLRSLLSSMSYCRFVFGARRIPSELPRQGKIAVAGLLHFVGNGDHVVRNRFDGMKTVQPMRAFAILCLLVSTCGPFASAQTPSASAEKKIWKSVEFAIVKFNDEAPKSWNIYHTEKKGLLLVHLWKRYLLVDMKEQEVYEIDPQTVTPKGDDVEWSLADKPAEPIETPEWKTRDLRSMEMVKFRLGKNGHFLEMQIPLQVNGKPVY